MESIVIRNLDPQTDLDEFVKFYNLAHDDYPEHDELTAEFAKKYIFDDPEFDETMNFLAIDDSGIIGRVRGDMETDTVGFVTLQLLPEHRTGAVAERLYEAALERLTSGKLDAVRTMVFSNFPEQISFFRSRGFNDKFRHYSMKRDMGEALPGTELPDDVTIVVPDLDNEYRLVRDAVEQGFSDTMDSTEEMMMNYDEFCKESYFKGDGVLVARDSEGCILGVCVAAAHPAMEGTGFIPWLAVLKGHRRKGLGRALLLSGLVWLESMKMKEAKLSVEVDNPNALNLYKDCGFEILSELIFMEKKLDVV